jgi:GNAT superfamily N-acetyltransferase
MVHPDLRAAPRVPLPNGCRIQRYTPDDRAAWVRINQAADGLQDISDATFVDNFGDDEAALGERMLFLAESGGSLVGTGTAWYRAGESDGGMGRVHWLAVLPAWQGRGLGKALLGAVCERLVELGHDQAYLTTSTARLPALCLYLGFGFRPALYNADDVTRWQCVAPHLPERLRAHITDALEGEERR